LTKDLSLCCTTPSEAWVHSLPCGFLSSCLFDPLVLVPAVVHLPPHGPTTLIPPAWWQLVRPSRCCGAVSLQEYGCPAHQPPALPFILKLRVSLTQTPFRDRCLVRMTRVQVEATAVLREDFHFALVLLHPAAPRYLSTGYPFHVTKEAGTLTTNRQHRPPLLPGACLSFGMSLIFRLRFQCVFAAA